METNPCLTYQAFIFRVRRHPERAFYQCTDVGFFESLAERREGGHNQTELLLPGGLSPSAAADLYHTLFNCQVGTLWLWDLIKIRILIKINTIPFSILDFISTFKIIVKHLSKIFIPSLYEVIQLKNLPYNYWRFFSDH